MPTETLIVVSAILAVFVIFMMALAWADLQTRRAARSK